MTQLATIEPLPDRLSARELLSRGQRITGAALLAAVATVAVAHAVTGRGPSWMQWGQLAIACTTVLYVVVIVFKLVLVHGAGSSPALRFSASQKRGFFTALIWSPSFHSTIR